MDLDFMIAQSRAHARQKDLAQARLLCQSTARTDLVCEALTRAHRPCAVLRSPEMEWPLIRRDSWDEVVPDLQLAIATIRATSPVQILSDVAHAILLCHLLARNGSAIRYEAGTQCRVSTTVIVVPEFTPDVQRYLEDLATGLHEVCRGAHWLVISPAGDGMICVPSWEFRGRVPPGPRPAVSIPRFSTKSLHAAAAEDSTTVQWEANESEPDWFATDAPVNDESPTEETVDLSHADRVPNRHARVRLMPDDPRILSELLLIPFRRLGLTGAAPGWTGTSVHWAHTRLRSYDLELRWGESTHVDAVRLYADLELLAEAVGALRHPELGLPEGRVPLQQVAVLVVPRLSYDVSRRLMAAIQLGATFSTPLHAMIVSPLDGVIVHLPSWKAVDYAADLEPDQILRRTASVTRLWARIGRRLRRKS